MQASTTSGQRAIEAISPEEWDILAQRLGVPARQMEVVRAIVAGHSKPQAIAQAMGIQPSSVKTHIERLHRNLGVHDRCQVVVMVFTELLTMRFSDGETGRTFTHSRTVAQPLEVA